MTFIKNCIENIKDRYLTWRTGMSKQSRDYQYWYDRHINRRATDIENYFQNFKHIIHCNYNKVLTEHAPMYGFIPNQEFLSFVYPNRPLGEHCEYIIVCGEWNQWDGRFHIHDFGLEEVFIATNSDEDAILLTLKFA